MIKIHILLAWYRAQRSYADVTPTRLPLARLTTLWPTKTEQERIHAVPVSRISVLRIVLSRLRSAFLLQMLTLWKVRGQGGEGRNLYGPDYTDVWAMSSFHFAASSDPECDHVSLYCLFNLLCCLGKSCRYFFRSSFSYNGAEVVPFGKHRGSPLCCALCGGSGFIVSTGSALSFFVAWCFASCGDRCGRGVVIFSPRLKLSVYNSSQNLSCQMLSTSKYSQVGGKDTPLFPLHNACVALHYIWALACDTPRT